MSRRQEKISRVIKESVSNTILNKLSDPRIQGLVSVTEVEVTPDLRQANVYLSIMAESEKVKRNTFRAIQHASKCIEFQLGSVITTRFCPELTFHEDVKFHKTLETMKLIDEAASEYKDKDEDQEEMPDQVDDDQTQE